MMDKVGNGLASSCRGSSSGIGSHLRDGLFTALRGGEGLLELRDRVSAETDALVGVEEGCLPQETLDAPHAANAHVDGYIAEGFGAELGLELLEALLRDGKVNKREIVVNSGYNRYLRGLSKIFRGCAHRSGGMWVGVDRRRVVDRVPRKRKTQRGNDHDPNKDIHETQETIS